MDDNEKFNQRNQLYDIARSDTAEKDCQSLYRLCSTRSVWSSSFSH